MKKLFSKVFLSMVLLLFFFGNGYTQTITNDAVSTNGQLQVKGLKLCNQYGHPIQLRGMSTHGIQWYGKCVTDSSLDVLANDWDADILRISLYVQEGGYETDPAGFTAKVAKMINMATDRGMYALVDWHQLTPGDPNFNTEKAKTFFTDIATQFKDYNNIIYDICNEPNKSGSEQNGGVPWSKIKNYGDTIIPVIRAIDADAPILIGTHGWASLGISDGKSAKDIVDNPLNFPNIMYTFHFYAASHQDLYYNELDWASDRLPIFVTEFGTQNYAGEGPNDFVMTQKYLDLLRRKKISWTNWNYSDDFRTGAVWKQGTCASGNWTDANLKEAGAWIKDKILNPADDFIIDPVSPPASPSSLSATTNSNSKINLSWLDNSDNESLFSIERSADGASGWVSIATTTANVTSYFDTGLTPNTTYYYRTRAENSGGNSSYSNTANATTKSETSIPPPYDYTDNVAPSVNPPDNLAVSDVPMFVSIGWDDNAISGYGDFYKPGGMKWILDFLKTKKNPEGVGNKRTYDGEPAWNTFLSTSNPIVNGSWGEDPSLSRKALRRAMMEKHEVGNHTRTHLKNLNGKTMTETQWFEEINNCTEDFKKPYPEQGVGLTRLFGFRAPRYEFNNNTYKVIKKLGIMYDCSGYSGSTEHTVGDGKDYYWPYTLDNGLPGKSSINSHPGIWRMPKHGLIDTDGVRYSSTDYTLLKNGWKADQFLRALKHTLDLRMKGNRSPMIFGGHTEIYADNSTFVAANQITPAERRKVIEDFLNYALTFPEVRIVSTKQILDWVRDPVALTDVSNNYDPPNNSQIETIDAPVAPGSLSATSNSNNQINITWADNSSNEDEFEVERSADSTSGWVSIANVSANMTNYLDAGLTANTTYYYRVKAKNTGGSSEYSNIANATTLSGGTAPEAPTSLVITTTISTQIDLGWTDNANNEDLFRIERSANGTSGWTSVGTTTINTSSYADTGLTSNTTYYYRVRAENTIGNSAYSNTVNVTTTAGNIALGKTATASSLETSSFPASFAVDGKDTTRWASKEKVDPQWISIDLGGAVNIDRVVLNWETAYAKAYRIEVSNDGIAWTSIYSTSTGNGKIDGLNISGTGRYIRMYGTARGTAYGYSLYEFEVYGTIGEGTGPEAPSSLSATAASKNQIDLSWTDNANNEDSFRIERSANGTSGWASVATTTINATSYSNVGLMANTTYYYRVRAENKTGNSSYSNTVNAATPPSGIPPLENIALNKTTSASSLETSSFPASFAVDGSNTTRWASLEGVDPQWVSIDLGAIANIERVVLHWEAAYAKVYRIEVSNDASAWTSIYSTSSGDGVVDDLNISGTGRYIRMYGTARGTTYGYSLYEFEVYGVFANRALNTIEPLSGIDVKAYPNPFTNNIDYAFDLEERTHVTLKLFSLKGAEIDVVIDKVLPAGNHIVKYDGTSLSSGIYIYRMQLDKGKSIYNYLIK
ncbi:cellulase family glycosylhydrolase [Aquimarina macrocephali]|uniref:cellulase family glycosylhydrolase n=1 Tax=Aquimarina macrocephali TaxID=666563 RepID=UPI000464EED1|nr:cellulase family glycosylhydrolase [Aquimarina macrocephali]